MGRRSLATPPARGWSLDLEMRPAALPPCRYGQLFTVVWTLDSTALALRYRPALP